MDVSPWLAQPCTGSLEAEGESAEAVVIDVDSEAVIGEDDADAESA